MHVLVGGGSGFIGKHLCKYLRQKGHTVTLVSRTEGEGRITWQQLRWGEAPKDVEAIINLSGSTFMELRPVAVTNLSSDHVREKWQTSRWMTAKICQMYAQDRSQEGNPLKCYVQGSSYLYYHSNLESENMVWTEEDKGGYHDPVNNWVRKWEEHAQFDQDIETRQVIIRTGNVLHADKGILRSLIAKYSMGLGGSHVSSGKSPAPWIAMDDIVGLFTFALEADHVTGVLNGVAPELANHQKLAKGVGKVMKRPYIGFSSPEWLIQFRYGADRCKILCESPWIAPERTLSSGYHFRFGTLESALPHLLQNRPGLLRIVFDYHLWHLGIFKEFLRTQYYHQRMEAENISYLAYSWMVSRKIIFAVLFLTFAANLDKYSVKFTELIHNIA